MRFERLEQVANEFMAFNKIVGACPGRVPQGRGEEHDGKIGNRI